MLITKSGMNIESKKVKETTMIYPQIKPFIRIFVIFTSVINFYGCINTRFLSKSELHNLDASKYYFEIHCSGKTFQLERPAKITNDTLSGIIIKTSSKPKSYEVDKINLYLSSRSDIRIENGEFIAIPINAFTKTEVERFCEGRAVAITFLLIGILGVTTLYCWMLAGGPSFL